MDSRYDASDQNLVIKIVMPFNHNDQEKSSLSLSSTLVLEDRQRIVGYLKDLSEIS